MLPPFSLIRWYASVTCVIDRSDRNPPFTATSLTFRPSLRHASGLRLEDFDPICRNIYDWGKFWKRFHGYFVFESHVSTKTVVSNCAKTFSTCKIRLFKCTYSAIRRYTCNYTKYNNRTTHVESTRAMTFERRSRAESENCEILSFSTTDRRFDKKVKCPTGRASFWVKFPTVRSLTRVKCLGVGRGGGGGMGGFGIDWYITGEVCKLCKEEKTLLKPSPKNLI